MNAILVGLERAAIFVTPVITEPGDKRRDVRVSIADLDLATPEGVAVFDRRLAEAVLRACGKAFYLDSAQPDVVERGRPTADGRAMELLRLFRSGKKRSDHKVGVQVGHCPPSETRSSDVK